MAPHLKDEEVAQLRERLAQRMTPMEICKKQKETAYYFFPPEVLPRLASRGIIEVGTASTTFFQMCVEPMGCHQSACAT